MATIHEIIVELEDQVADVVKQVTAEAKAELKERNPVQTGWSHANWIPGIGTPPTVPAGSRQAVSYAEQERGLALILSSYTVNQGIVTIQNNVPYITTINDFHPTKAGFVQTAIDVAVNAVKARIG